MKSICSRVVLAISLLVGSVVQAAVVDNLYQSELLVPEQLAQPTDKQLSEALRDVLVKVSGRSQIAGNAKISEALQAPAVYLQGFAYESTQIPVAAGDGREVLGLRLKLAFDTQAIRGLLSDAGLSAVGGGRPGVLVWLVAEGPERPRDFVAAESEIVSELQALAAQRALPVLLPLLDLDDQQALSPGDIWGAFQEPVNQASARYRPDAVLVGRLQRLASGAWNTRWQLSYQERHQTYAPTGSLAEQLEAVVNSVGDRLLGGTSVVESNYVEDGIVLEISKLNSIDDYLQLLTYMRELQPVEQVLPAQLENDTVTLRVEVQGGVPALLEAIRLNPRIQSDSVLPSATVAGPLYYRWQ